MPFLRQVKVFFPEFSKLLNFVFDFAWIFWFFYGQIQLLTLSCRNWKKWSLSMHGMWCEKWKAKMIPTNRKEFFSSEQWTKMKIIRFPAFPVIRYFFWNALWCFRHWHCHWPVGRFMGNSTHRLSKQSSVKLPWVTHSLKCTFKREVRVRRQTFGSSYSRLRKWLVLCNDIQCIHCFFRNTLLLEHFKAKNAMFFQTFP